MQFHFVIRSGDVLVPMEIPITVGEEFSEGTARYRVEAIETDSHDRPRATCRLVSGRHPFWWTGLLRGEDLVLDEPTAARVFYEKRAFHEATGFLGQGGPVVGPEGVLLSHPGG